MGFSKIPAAQTVREPAVAGQFYPGDAQSLGQMLDLFLSEASRNKSADADGAAWPKALIVPHAGYVYSGAVAASAYACLTEAKDTIRRVVLLGPAHRVAFRGIAIPSVAAFKTPLGDVALDQAALDEIKSCADVLVSDEAHAQEHSLEVHLPFLQSVLGDFSLVPLCVGDAQPEAVANILEKLWGGPETLIVISSDLSHYHTYDEARLLDQATAQAIVDKRADLVTSHGACGGRPIRGLLKFAERHDLKISLLDLCNSGDTADTKDRVVGYAAFRVDETPVMKNPAVQYDDAQRSEMLKIARQSIAHGLESRKPLNVVSGNWPDWALENRASFVTLELNGKLRGCIGSLQAHRSLVSDIAENAFAAAFRDPRFAPLNDAEFAKIEMGISVLSSPEPMEFSDEVDLLAQVRPGIDGLILKDKGHRSTFLPQVWEQMTTKSLFIMHLKRKAGLPDDHWSDDLEVWRYTTETFK